MIWQVKENCVEQRWKNGEWTCAYACNDSNLLLQNETTEFGDWIHIVFSCNLVAVRLCVTTCTNAQSYSSMSNIQGSDCQRRISVECGPVGQRIYKLCALPLSESTWPPCPNSWTQLDMLAQFIGHDMKPIGNSPSWQLHPVKVKRTQWFTTCCAELWQASTRRSLCHSMFVGPTMFAPDWCFEALNF